MQDLINTIIAFLLPRNDLFLYLFLFVSAVIENLFPPIPGDTITILGAFLVGTGRLSYPLVYIATTAGSVAGFMALVFAGRLLEREFFMKKNYPFFSARSIISAEMWFSRYGYFVVLANRFLPGIRSVISLVSGLARLDPVKIFFLSLISAAIWNLIWIETGFLLGNNWNTVRDRAGDLFRSYNIGAGILIALFVAVFFIVKIIKKRRAANNKPAGR